jgi:DnaJ-class molecular chaperone
VNPFLKDGNRRDAGPTPVAAQSGWRHGAGTVSCGPLQTAETNHYATLGLDRRCTAAQIHAAYRLLAKQHHPDLHPGSPTALQRTQALNAAHEILGDPDRRAAYDREFDAAKKSPPLARASKIQRNISLDVNLRLEDFLRGTTREVQFHDPANPDGPETYELVIPPDTAPGIRFRLPRTGALAGGWVHLRVKAMPHFRFKARGSDLRCDLKIKPERAVQGGAEMMPGLTGDTIRVPVPRGAGRNEIVRITGAGLPRLRGGRGDLLVRIRYRVTVQVSRPTGR